MKPLFIKYAGAALLLAATGAVKAQNTTLSVTNAAVPSLQISPDAKAGGMGDVAIATDADASSVYYNLAKIVFAKKKSGASANYTPWMKDVADDMSLSAVSGYHQLSDEQAIGASLRYFNMGNVDLIDYNGNKLQTNHPNEFTLDLGYARKLSPLFSAGVALRYISSGLVAGTVNGTDYKRGNTVAADVSLFYNGLKENAKGWTAGLTLANLGGKIGYSNNAGNKGFLPASLNLGFAYREALDDKNGILLGGDVNKLLVPEMPDSDKEVADYYNKGVVSSWFSGLGNKAWQFGLGTEYNYMEKLYLRLGYRSQSYTGGSWQFITAGLGLQFDIASINFSYLVPTGDKVNRNPYVNTVRLGVQFGWGK
ncbi:type IX secretion system outer membrane channel protein PorV [Filimonas lacunae]|nr:type IX secretion system outer membrane channel protein PorV [Filimonas lacunae]